MNIFILDTDVERCAQYHCDQHLNKMILESVQLLCTALNKKGVETPYRSTHQKHPCVLWVEESFDNFLWLRDLTLALNREAQWRYRHSRDHASISVLHQLDQFEFSRNGLSQFPQAMPDQYKVAGDAVAAYRQFYIGDKSRFASWSRGREPDWYRAGVALAG